MRNAVIEGSEVRDEFSEPSYSVLDGVALLDDSSSLGADSLGSDSLEDCEIPSKVSSVCLKASLIMSALSLVISLLILASIFLLSW